MPTKYSPVSLATRPLTSRDIARFWAKVDRSGGPDACWPWTAARSPQGYGSFRLGSRCLPSHRVAWVIANGPLADDRDVCHRCDNPPCNNPTHLFDGDALANIRDCHAKGRYRAPRVTGEHHGQARFTWAEIDAIRAEFTAGGVTQNALARKHKAGRHTIQAILAGRTWRLEDRPPP